MRRELITIATAAALLLIGSLAAGCTGATIKAGGDGAHVPKETALTSLPLEKLPPQNPSRSLGKLVYQKNCASCHGMVGPELTATATSIVYDGMSDIPAMPPTDASLERSAVAKDPSVLAKGPYSDLYTYHYYDNGSDFAFAKPGTPGGPGKHYLGDKKYMELYELISSTDGHPTGSQAVEFHTKLGTRERWAVVYYIANMSLDNGTLNWKQNWDDELMNRKDIFGKNCSICHGGSGRGDGPEGEHLEPVPMNLTTLDWAVGERADYPVTSEYIHDIIYNGKISPGTNTQWTGMPFWGDQLREEDIWALVDFIRSLSYTAD